MQGAPAREGCRGLQGALAREGERAARVRGQARDGRGRQASRHGLPVCGEERARRIWARAASSHAWREQHAHAHARWGVAGVSRPTGLTETPSWALSSRWLARCAAIVLRRWQGVTSTSLHSEHHTRSTHALFTVSTARTSARSCGGWRHSSGGYGSMHDKCRQRETGTRSVGGAGRV